MFLDNLISDLPKDMFHRYSPALTDLNLAKNNLTLAKFAKAGKFLINLSTLNLAKNAIRSELAELRQIWSWKELCYCNAFAFCF